MISSFETSWNILKSWETHSTRVRVVLESAEQRVLKRVATSLGFAVTLHMFRRGFATLAHASGGTLRDIQEQLRHASATTANVYVQAVPESVRETVEKMDRALRKKAKAAKEKI
jgi:integrase